LITVRAVECLGRADLVVYDRLVPPRLLDYAPAAAERLCVTALAGRHADRSELVPQALIDAARQGRCVVRLKGGDPFVFGRGGEEAEALRQAGIPYEIVPGVTSGLAAAACAGIPLTHRHHASGVALLAGHEDGAKAASAVDWANLANFPGTLVVYMGLSRLPVIVQELLTHGKPADTPAAAIHWGTTGEQRTVEAPLAELPGAVAAAGLTSPTVVVIGPVVALRQRLAWFESRPLFGKRILVTRPRHQAAGFVSRLEELGATVLVWPVVEIREPADWGPADRALANLSSYQWLVFTSANGVHAVVRRLRQLGRDLRALGGLRLAAIGPGTAEALRGYWLEPDVVPAEYRSEALAAALCEPVRGQRVLLARADRGRDVLREELAAVAEVEQVAVYSQVDAAAVAEVLECLRRGEIDYITLTSSNIARGLVRVLDETGRGRIVTGQVQLVSISPVTSAAVRELGLPVAAEATVYTMEGLVAALVALAARRAPTAGKLSCNSGPGWPSPPLARPWPRHSGSSYRAGTVPSFRPGGRAPSRGPARS
jgi:uroporphyrinogen III methyltransferase/synthase